MTVRSESIPPPWLIKLRRDAAPLFHSGHKYPGGPGAKPPVLARAILLRRGLPGGRLLPIDDNEKCTEGTRSRGWNAFHVTDATGHRLPGFLGID